jgi:hypothetical protein
MPRFVARHQSEQLLEQRLPSEIAHLAEAIESKAFDDYLHSHQFL